MKRGIGQALPLRSPVRSLFSLPLKTRAISSVVERLLHTQEVAGSIPASRMAFSLTRKQKRDSIERSPRRQVAGSIPASRISFLFARHQRRDSIEWSPAL